MFFYALDKFDRISLDRLESIDEENALGDRANKLMFVAPRVKLFESV